MEIYLEAAETASADLLCVVLAGTQSQICGFWDDDGRVVLPFFPGLLGDPGRGSLPKSVAPGRIAAVYDQVDWCCVGMRVCLGLFAFVSFGSEERKPVYQLLENSGGAKLSTTLAVLEDALLFALNQYLNLTALRCGEEKGRPLYSVAPVYCPGVLFVCLELRNCTFS